MKQESSFERKRRIQDVFLCTINKLIDNEEDFYSNNHHLLEEMLLDDRKNYLLKELNFEKFLEILTNFNKQTNPLSYKEIKSILHNILNTEFKDDVKQIISNVKQEYSDSYIEKTIIHNMQAETQHITIMNLPKDAKDILKKIYDLYKKMQHSTIQLNETQLYDINNLFEKRVPEILKKYLTIDDQYKTILKNTNGKNSEELMIDSLMNIYSYFETTWQNINSQAVSALSVSNRYTQNFKK